MAAQAELGHGSPKPGAAEAEGWPAEEEELDDENKK